MLSVGVGIVNGYNNDKVDVVDAATTYTETTFQAGRLLITTTYNSSNYYLPTTKSTNKAPTATSFTNVNDISEDNLWTVTANGSNWYIQNSDGDYLYAGSSNNSVRVGSTQYEWTYDSTNNYFKGSTSRYLGIYNGADWRSYNTVNASNYKESSTAFVFYTIPSVDDGKYTVKFNAGDGIYDAEDLTYDDGTTNNVTLPTNVTNKYSNYINETITFDGFYDNNENVYEPGDAVEVTTDIQFTPKFTYPSIATLNDVSSAKSIATTTGETNSPFKCQLTGEVKSIDTVYNNQYSNITITLTDGENDISCYRLAGGENLAVNDEITVTGYIVNQWGNTPQFVAGTTYEYVNNGTLETPTVSYNAETNVIEWNAVTGATGYTIYILDGEGNEFVNKTVTTTSYDTSTFGNDTYTVTVKALGNNNYADSAEADLEFTISKTAADQLSVVNTVSSLGFKYTTSTSGEDTSATETIDFTTKGYANAKEVTTETSGDITVTFDKGSNSNTPKYYTTGSAVRVYGGNTVTVSSSSENIKKIAITFGESDGTNTISVDSGEYADGVWTGDASSVKFTIDGTSGNRRFVAIDVTYGNSATTTYSFTNVKVRFMATVSKEIYESLTITSAGFEIEAEGYSDKLIANNCPFDTDDNGDYYIIASVNVPEAMYSVALRAKAFFVVDGTTVYGQVSTAYSVNTITDAYLADSVYNTLSEESQKVIKAFDAQLA